ncbi:hypothetical protein LCGC14_1243070 [marine sediment metagenome]|uniref:Uncharacterized protein n=1 Tax=marine sediment metagenome TaxID=412755 RepID=A0A0F9LSE5_9ZZZZ
MTKDYESMSVEALDAENQRLQGQRDTVREELRRLVAVRDRKAVLEAAERQVAAMGEPEVAALAQVIQAQGIESGEAVGEPGASG